MPGGSKLVDQCGSRLDQQDTGKTMCPTFQKFSFDRLGHFKRSNRIAGSKDLQVLRIVIIITGGRSFPIIFSVSLSSSKRQKTDKKDKKRQEKERKEKKGKEGQDGEVVVAASYSIVRTVSCLHRFHERPAKRTKEERKRKTRRNDTRRKQAGQREQCSPVVVAHCCVGWIAWCPYITYIGGQVLSP